MKKYILLLGGILSLSGSAWAATEIKFWQFWNEDWIKPIIEDFEKENPDIQIKLERLTWSDGFNKVVTALAANQGPDVIEIGSTWVAGLSQDGGLKPIVPGDLLQKLSNWEPTYYKGKYYGVPWTLSTVALFYNEELLQKTGFKEPPKNWQELLKQSQAVHKLGENIYGYGLKTGAYSTWQRFLPYAWSNEARLISSDWKSTQVASKNFSEAVQFYKNLEPYSLFDENIVVRKQFQEGKVGFMLEEPGQIAIFKKETPNLRFSTVPLPASPKGKSINFAGAQILAITKNTKNKEAAEKFIRFLVRAENAKAITERITSLFPADKKAAQSDFYKKQHPELLVFLDTLKTATSPQAHPRWIEIQEVFSEQLERILFGENLEKALKKAEKEIQFILEEEL
jgi:ABC-type glycerol-3-phosphate transport system substrate-binding protein